LRTPRAPVRADGEQEPIRGRARPRTRTTGLTGPCRPPPGRPRSTTQIDTAVRLSAGTDSQPGPTPYPNHGSHGAAPRTAGPAPFDRAAVLVDASVRT